MEPGQLKPLLAALVLPPAGPLLLALLGVLLAMRRRAAGLALAAFGIAAAFVLATNGCALLLAPHLLPGVRAVTAQELRDVQAIVVLGGGVQPEAPEYGEVQPGANTLQRLRYGAWLAQRTGKPLAFAGGVGWGGMGVATETEGAVARRVLAEYGLQARWIEDRSRDTAENATRTAAILLPEGVRRIALVTDASHIPRAAAAFRAAGFDVVPAPTGFPGRRAAAWLEWLPSIQGMQTNHALLREGLARLVARAR